ncbi:hypothetical protein HMPREF9419_0308 [Prevotella nigrescens ATCC 33563]|nr:hypothetical protein HMPREF9419_0308 [Prevotella nigrescens ATCC 33563]
MLFAKRHIFFVFHTENLAITHLELLPYLYNASVTTNCSSCKYHIIIVPLRPNKKIGI